MNLPHFLMLSSDYYVVRQTGDEYRVSYQYQSSKMRYRCFAVGPCSHALPNDPFSFVAWSLDCRQEK